MKLQLEFNTEKPDENNNIFSESVFEGIIGSAKDAPVFVGFDIRPIGSVKTARRNSEGVELDVHLDESRPETEFFEKGHIVYSVSCAYQNMDFEQTGNVRVIKSAQLQSVTIEPGRKFPPVSTIFTIK